MKIGPSLAVMALVAASACSRPPDPAVVEALTAGVWHAPVGEDDYVYELTFEDGAFGGRVHRVTDGRQINEIPVSGVSLRGAVVEIGNRGFPSYRGQADLEAGRIEGGVPSEPRFREMNLTRVEAGMWPMIRPRSGPAPGEPAYVWSRPKEREDGWATAAPSEVGVDQAAVEETVRAILADEAAALHSLLVVRDGQLVVEEYFHGWGPDDLHHIASCTKSISSLLVGIAIDQGHLSGTDVPLLEVFPQFADGAGAGWDEMRLEHLLTMTMGLDWAAEETSGWPPLDDQFAQVLGRNVVEPPGSRWRYVSRQVNLLSGVFSHATGVEADVFAAEHLFVPLGITNWDWEFRRWEGHPDMAAALKLRPRDMAKLGQLALDQGSWQGRQVVPAEWIRESTRTHISETPYEVEYGYLWWRTDSRLGPVTFANGRGSQYILVAPEARMVVVTTGGNDFNGRQSDILGVVDRHLVPGVFQAVANLDRGDPAPVS